jgi:hypothetical protein
MDGSTEQIDDATGPVVRCGHCEERIGVYEPIVHAAGNAFERTSRAATPGLDNADPGDLFHLECHQERQG